jgi:peroxiredoxin Q/BCP
MAVLSVGEKAPDFSVKTHAGETVNMNLQPVGSLTKDGRYAVLMWFYPRAGDSACTVEGKRFQELLEAYADKGVKVVGVSNDDADANGAFATSCGFEFPLLCDTKNLVSVAYGAAASAGAEKATRCAVLIDRDGVVKQVWPSVDARTFPDECLAGLPEPPPPPEPYQKPTLQLNMDKLPPAKKMVCAGCGFKWNSGAYTKPECPKCLLKI